MSITKSGPLGAYRRRLGNETFAASILVLGAVIALIWANSPWRETYETISSTVVGPESLHLDLSIASWASDGLLAIFFFLVGLELKEEFVTGSLRDMRQALVPVLAAVCGMVGPIAVYVLVQVVFSSGNFDGWAVPVATDIAFALAVLGLFGKGLPPAARVFLLTLAVVDDLLGIVIIAVAFSSGINIGFLLGAFAVIALFGFLVQKRVTAWWILWPIGIVAWALMHAAGVHATIAGVLMGLTVPALTRPNENPAKTHWFIDRLDFWSSGFVLPIFAFFAAGVNIVDSGGLMEMLKDPVAIGIYLGLPFGKLLGIWGGVFIMTKLLPLRLGQGLRLGDIAGISLVAGVGFTVSLLIATLSFEPGDPHGAHARVAVILGSVLALALGGIMLRMRAKAHQRADTIDETKPSQDARGHGSDDDRHWIP